MTPTKFTIVIPTRERCDTLEHSLRTCVTQDYEPAEFIVSDNFSQDRTREVATSFRDNRIRYVNTGRRVSMPSNWEFGLSHASNSHASGGYVTFIGDDDGLLPGALKRLNTLFAELGNVSAFTWRIATYGWPNHAVASERNRLLVPMGSAVKRWTARSVLADVARFKSLYFLLPTLYNSFVRLEAIQRVKAQSGRFFCSVTPDVYSGVALATVIEDYYYSLRPYALNGVSQHSQGVSQLSDKGTPEANRQYSAEYGAENDLAFNPQLVTAPSVALLTAEALMQAKLHLATASHLEVDLKLAMQAALKTASIQTAEQYAAVAKAVSTIGERNGLQAEADALLAAIPSRPKDNTPILGYNVAFDVLRLPTEPFDVKDICGASVLCQHILTLSELGYHTPRGVGEATLRFAAKFLKGGGDHYARSQKAKSVR